MKVLYLTCLENTYKNDIHSNQVLGLSGHGVSYNYLFMSAFLILNRAGLSINKNKFDAKNIEEIKLPILSYHLCMHIYIIPYYILVSMIPFLIKVRKEKPDVVHCRNLISTLLAVSARIFFGLKYKIVCDPRSVYVEECVITHTFKYGGFNYCKWKKLERFLYGHSDACIGLSEYFKTYLSQYNINSYFVPAIVNDSSIYNGEKRTILRLNHGLHENDIVFCYIGSIGAWHTSDKLEFYFDNIINTIPKNKNFKIVFLSENKGVCERYIKKYGEDKIVKCGRVKPADILDYLLLSDYGMVPGSDNNGYCYDLLYKTMISSKAEEYLVAGLPIMVNPHIFSLAEMVVKYEAGLLLDDQFADRAFNRDEISKNFLLMFSVKHVVNSYSKIYKSLV